MSARRLDNHIVNQLEDVLPSIRNGRNRGRCLNRLAVSIWHFRDAYQDRSGRFR